MLDFLVRQDTRHIQLLGIRSSAFVFKIKQIIFLDTLIQNSFFNRYWKEIIFVVTQPIFQLEKTH